MENKLPEEIKDYYYLPRTSGWVRQVKFWMNLYAWIYVCTYIC